MNSVKNKISLFALIFCILITSCSTTSKSWSTAKNSKPAGTIRLKTVFVDKPNSWFSVEKEIENLTPLLFLDYGYIFLSEDEKADYIIDVHAIEREYISGWKTKRSVSIEVRIWKDDGIDNTPAQFMPLAAGMAIASGNKSLSSSKVLNSLLNSAIKKAVQELKR